MDFKREWTPFALEAEIQAHGVTRICKAHNEMVAEKQRIYNSMRGTEDQLIEVARHVDATCGEGLPQGSGDTLAKAIIRKIDGV
jgi:hypothetical protein